MFKREKFDFSSGAYRNRHALPAISQSMKDKRALNESSIIKSPKSSVATEDFFAEALKSRMVAQAVNRSVMI